MLSQRIITISFLLCSLTQVVLAHPSDGYPPIPLGSIYGEENRGLPIEWEINDLDFVQTYPAPETLTTAEIYMIGGCMYGPDGDRLRPWKNIVLDEAQRFYYKFGYLPEQLTPDVISQAWGLPEHEIYPWVMEQIISPITGDYPYINQQNFSPGNLYIRPLTEDEMWHIASYSAGNYKTWFEGMARPGPSKWGDANPVREPVTIKSVFYLRLYGRNDVINTSIITSMKPE